MSFLRTINSDEITAAIKEMCIRANIHLPCDVMNRLKQTAQTEINPLGQDTLQKLAENAQYAETAEMPICQDTGMAVIFAEIGQEVHILGNLEEAIHEGVRQGYTKGYLRKSVVSDPLNRINTNDNTPAVIHYQITQGDKIKLTVAPKGFGSENMSALKMLKPADGKEGVIDFVIDTAKNAGSNPCPPIVVGVGIGGDFELCAKLAKQALLLPLDHKPENEYYYNMQCEILERINQLGIGPQGFGGNTTALGVNILTYPTHIAGLPVAVNISCHVTRHIERII